MGFIYPPVTVKVAMSSATSSTTAGTWTIEGGTPGISTLYPLTVTVPPGATQIIAVVATGWAGGIVNDVNEVVVCSGSNISVDQNLSSFPAVGNSVKSTSDYFMVGTGGSLSLTTTSIVIPVITGGNLYSVTVFYI
jgi:hypothetical protein